MHAEGEGREDPGRWQGSPLPCITKLGFPPFSSAIDHGVVLGVLGG
jgi:hypothetical protein